jgi:hypothetical protein
MKLLVEDAKGVRELEEGYASEHELQVFLREHSQLVPMDEIDLGTPPLLCIGWEVQVTSGSEDLLYIDETGLLTIVETKLKKNREVRREVLGQVLEYAAYAADWSAPDVIGRAEKFFKRQEYPEEYRGSSLEAELRRFLESTHSPIASVFSYANFLAEVTAKLQRGNIRLIIAVDEPPPSLLKTVEFVNRFSRHFEVYLFQLSRFHDKATKANVFVPRLFGRVAKPEEQKVSRLWDREQFLAQAREKWPKSSATVERLLEFAQEQNVIHWGRGAKVGTFWFSLPMPDEKLLSAVTVGADGTMYIDFKALASQLDAAVIEEYRNLLLQAPSLPREFATTKTWKTISVMTVSDQPSWDAFRRAVLHIRDAVAGLRDS